jgi:hypothetical protein
MVRIFTILIFSLFLVYVPVRPPEPPVPFPYDSSLVNSEILRTLQVRPTSRLTYIPLKVIEPDGEYGTLTCSDPNVNIPVAVTTIDPADPNGISRIHSYLCSLRVGLTPRVLYEEFT